MAAGADAHDTLGKYRLLARLGTGGMAEVMLARFDGPGGFTKHVAIKRMRPELTRSKEFVGLFLEEARTASMLGHPNICQVHELGAEGGEYYMVLEYLEGVPLSYLLAQQLEDCRSWELGVLVGAVAQACEGIHHAHEAVDASGQPLRIIHRDVSPPNLFVTDDGVVKVLDFGISKSRASVIRTMTGQIRGKFAYMSPEQLRGEPLDRRSDVFALGIVLAELVTGRRLFRRSNRLDVFKAIVREPMPSVRELRPDLPDLLTDVADRALARNRDERFDSARALGVALAGAAREIGGLASPGAIGGHIALRFARELAARRELLVHPPGIEIDLAATAARSRRVPPPTAESVDSLAATRDDSGDESTAPDEDSAADTYALLGLPPDLWLADLAGEDTE